MVLGASGWCAIALGIFVEGRSDRESHKHLLRKLGHASIRDRVVDQGDMLNAGTMQRHIQAVLHLHQGYKPRPGAEGFGRRGSGRDVYDLMRPAERELREQFPGLGINYVVVDHSIEGWLLCDPEALRGGAWRTGENKRPGEP